MSSDVVISDLAAANSRCESLLDAPFIGFDSEGVNLGPGGELTLIQVIDPNHNVTLFDVLTCPAILSGKLKEVLEDPSILKIVHDCRHDRVNLQEQFGVRLQPVFDTQIAHMIIFGVTWRIGFNALCQKFKLRHNSLKDKVHGMYAENNAIWKTRPLTQDLIRYATEDVISLIPLYKRMNPKIRLNDRARFERMCRDA